MNFPVFFLIVANLLWGFIPYPAAKLMGAHGETWGAPALVALRFLVSGIFLAVLSLVWGHLAPRNGGNAHGFVSVIKYLKGRDPHLPRAPRYLTLLTTGAIGFTAQILFFFLAIRELGAVVSSLGFMVALVAVALVQWLLGREDMSALKGLYLVVLVGASALLAAWAPETGTGHLTLRGVLFTLSYGLCMAFFILTSGDDPVAPGGHNTNEPVFLRMLWKLSYLFISAALCLAAAMAFLVWVGPKSWSAQGHQFFAQLSRWHHLAGEPSAYILVGLCTLAPFLIYYGLAATWRGPASFSMWAGVLSLLEPLVGMGLGVLLLGENYPRPWLAMVIALVVLGIALKWLTEKEAQVHAFLLVDTRWGSGRGPFRTLCALPMVHSVKALAGPRDLCVEVIAPSLPKFQHLVRETIPGVCGVTQVEVLHLKALGGKTNGGN